ncbi:hypothetical protein V6N11_004223 [Hibiscus sabdariffa]|uniref:Cystatin domain-containing protein n=1 Tax=Hibiscus sabdariffa TaxID=183260 RepID=A0ABR2SFP0_9ROSI
MSGSASFSSPSEQLSFVVPDPDSDSDDGSRITEEEERLYAAAVEASDGFDVPNLPGVIACCLIKPSGFNRKYVNPFCVAGMKHYNQDKKTNYEFVRLIKANYRYARGFLFYLTFEGRTPENNTKIFEAQVLAWIPGEDSDVTEVYFCREKASLTKTGSSGN